MAVPEPAALFLPGPSHIGIASRVRLPAKSWRFPVLRLRELAGDLKSFSHSRNLALTVWDLK